MPCRKTPLALAALLAAGAAHAELTTAQRLADFDHFWKTYADAYVFFELKKGDHGVDWKAVGDQLRAKVAASTTDRELYAAITEAQAALRDGHCYNAAFAKIRETEPIHFQRIQLTLVEEGRVGVLKVPEGTAFAKAGIAVGDELLAIDGATIRQLAERARPLQAASSDGMFWSSFAEQLYIFNPLRGSPESPTATLVFKKASGETVEVVSPWNQAPPTGRDPEPMGFAGGEPDEVALTQAEATAVEGPLPFDVRIFKDWNIGYLGLSTWMKTEDPLAQMDQAMTVLKDTAGLVIDMRGNGGGVGPWGVLLTNHFVKPTEKAPNDSWMERKLSKAFFMAAFPKITEEQLEQVFQDPAAIQYVLSKAFGLELTVDEVKAKHFKDGRFQPFDLRLALNDRVGAVPTYEKPVFVLTDGGCYSTTDIFVTILDEFKRITIVGTPNGAGSGSPIPFTLPHSKLTVYVPHARAYPPFGSMIEGRPRPPTIAAPQTLADLQKGRDTALNKAVKALWQKLNPGTIQALTRTFDVGPGERLLPAPARRAIAWGDIPTPDWAIDAKLRTQVLRELELPRRGR